MEVYPSDILPKFKTPGTIIINAESHIKIASYFPAIYFQKYSTKLSVLIPTAYTLLINTRSYSSQLNITGFQPTPSTKSDEQRLWEIWLFALFAESSYTALQFINMFTADSDPKQNTILLRTWTTPQYQRRTNLFSLYGTYLKLHFIRY
jgi:hypothetical protein